MKGKHGLDKPEVKISLADKAKLALMTSVTRPQKQYQAGIPALEKLKWLELYKESESHKDKLRTSDTFTDWGQIHQVLGGYKTSQWMTP